jgi:hypothetical protein
MLQRCTNPRNPSYPRYGGKGITVCERWRSFDNFLTDMGPRPEGTSIDRMDNARGYEPANCRWATSFQQAQNTSVAVSITAFGETRCLSEWARLRGLSLTTLHSRLRLGWSPERALSTPASRKLGTAKLTVKDAREVHRLKAAGVRRLTIARIFGVDKTTIFRTLRGAHWPEALDATTRSRDGA